MSVYWRGAADTCDICGGPIAVETGTKIVDGRTRGGPWALMDEGCHKIHGVGTGTGHGQVYQRQENTTEAANKGRLWLKVEG
jgi:hypothetical protein